MIGEAQQPFVSCNELSGRVTLLFFVRLASVGCQGTPHNGQSLWHMAGLASSLGLKHESSLSATLSPTGQWLRAEAERCYHEPDSNSNQRKRSPACRLSDAEAAKLGMRRGRSAYNAEPIQWDAGLPLERRVKGTQLCSQMPAPPWFMCGNAMFIRWPYRLLNSLWMVPGKEFCAPSCRDFRMMGFFAGLHLEAGYVEACMLLLYSTGCCV